MSEQLTLSAETRERAGKGASRHLRRDGRVPAVVYGNNEAPLSIHVEEKVLMKALNTGHFMNSVVMIDAGGQPVRTLPKDVQFHPVTDRPLHVDFLRISEHATVTVAVPIRFINDELSKGIKRGGVLNAVRHELDLVCDAAEIPEDVIVDLAGTDIGDSIHISAVTLPKGTTSAITDRDFTIATIVAPSGVKAEAAEAAAAAEGAEEPAADEVPTVGEDAASEGGEEAQ
ncbi:50S ribosomal protein L25/general stress protein Ctc [Sphingosinicella sp. LHD-64]|uniref:50S ribosomal protein L25/general stress protein Ctc n=1 Tax=Sphingosinicella sp. LHD-64 TaxID=3072139 RepID=UPI00280F7544|nr:50S ribosomal protein L25/general stress protein Ctc [Sphingosinicella sp. LHD-64]MDQ8758138.1 50S ribosomal protein L25/general stress protein Ctc [Sphingosinicella sp. LHD-64]